MNVAGIEDSPLYAQNEKIAGAEIKDSHSVRTMTYTMSV